MRSDGQHQSQMSFVPERPVQVEIGDVEDEDFDEIECEEDTEEMKLEKPLSFVIQDYRLRRKSGSGAPQCDTFAFPVVVSALCERFDEGQAPREA